MEWVSSFCWQILVKIHPLQCTEIIEYHMVQWKQYEFLEITSICLVSTGQKVYRLVEYKMGRERKGGGRRYVVSGRGKGERRGEILYSVQSDFH